MRHFAHHIGDYAAATAHLSFVEDAAYHRLLRRYYQDEKPLPADIATVQRLVGARTRDERGAVATVLGEFFILGEDGWRQPRADRELEAYRARAQAARENGNRGGRPTKTEKKPDGFFSGSQEEPDEKLTNNHEPITNNQSDNSTAKRGADRGSRLPEDWQPSAEDRAFAADLGLDPQLTGDEFRDYWTAIPGARGRKLNWSKTFRNRCRELAARPRPRGPGKPTLHTVTADENWPWRIKGWRESQFWMPTWGPEPGKPGCFVPKEFLQ